MKASKQLFVALFVLCFLLHATHSGGSTLQESRLSYVRAHPDLDRELQNAILNGYILPGMTADQVEASWGSKYKLGMAGEFGGLDYIYFLYGEQVVYFDQLCTVVRVCEAREDALFVVVPSYDECSVLSGPYYRGD